MPIPLINPFTFGIMLVIAVGTVAYGVWSNNQQNTNYGHSNRNHHFDYNATRIINQRASPRVIQRVSRKVASTVPDDEDKKKNGKMLKPDNDEPECGICLAPLNGKRIVLSCDHIFHYECLQPWLNDHGTCPNCRSNET
ncbi:unnamed protein product [Phaedon cochleariae]|uniref:RING-type domain-containing protein n=1 Tax=Phaedon cochleariae TaxID=80249 RepID=A0A9P0DNZ3_PHACE|nr:unnamed protein product [Phaedon cochleariae]